MMTTDFEGRLFSAPLNGIKMKIMAYRSFSPF